MNQYTIKYNSQSTTYVKQVLRRFGPEDYEVIEDDKSVELPHERHLRIMTVALSDDGALSVKLAIMGKSVSLMPVVVDAQRDDMVNKHIIKINATVVP